MCWSLCYDDAARFPRGRTLRLVIFLCVNLTLSCAETGHFGRCGVGTPDLLSPLGLAVSLFICLLVQFWGRLLDYLSDVCTPCSAKLLRTRPRHRHPDGGGVVGPAWLCLFLSPFTTLLPLGLRPVVAPLLRGCHSAVVRGAQGPDPDCPPPDPRVVGPMSVSVFEVSPWGFVLAPGAFLRLFPVVLPASR